jgi:hypothetical protein
MLLYHGSKQQVPSLRASEIPALDMNVKDKHAAPLDRDVNLKDANRTISVYSTMVQIQDQGAVYV